jgi:hypothetical protein
MLLPMNLYYRIICGVLGLLLLGISFWTAQTGFSRILDFRMLERIPLSTVSGALTGEVQLKGTSIAMQTTQAPKTGTPSIYYRYLVEKEERDSDGNRSWRTVQDDTVGHNFKLLDHSGEALIKLQPSAGQFDVSVPERYSSESGGYRYTEWRLQNNDTVTVFGWLEDAEPAAVNFYVTGDYVPILSTFGAAAERQGFGFSAVLWLWAGITAMICFCLCLMVVFQIHKTLAFLSTVSVACMFMLFQLGYQSLQHDVATGYRQIVNHLERTQQVAGTPRYSEAAVMNELMQARYQTQISRFPESWYAKLMGMDQPKRLSLTPVEQARADARQSEFLPTQLDHSYVWAPIILVVAALLAWFAFRVIRVKRIQENIPTSKTAGVTYGLTEVVGTLKAEDQSAMLQGPVSSENCTWYRYLIEERRGSGKNRKWVTISDDVFKQPFLVSDDEGELRVFPGQADIISRHKESRREGGRRYTEWRLSPGDDLYILGSARLDKTRGDSLVLGHGKDTPYIIANIPEAAVMFKKAINGMSLLSLGASLVFLGAILVSGSNGGFSSVDFIQAALISPAFLLMVVLVMMYNDLVFLRERCDRNWANIQVSLKKRANLIPQLEAVVKEYLRHESNLQTGLALLRERSRAVDNSRDMDQYMAAEHISLAELSARIEQYPDLKATTLIADFHRRLVKLENEVALIRSGFNDAVTQYLTRTQTFPDNLISKLFGFQTRTRLSFEEAAHKIPTVQSDSF